MRLKHDLDEFHAEIKAKIKQGYIDGYMKGQEGAKMGIFLTRDEIMEFLDRNKKEKT